MYVASSVGHVGSVDMTKYKLLEEENKKLKQDNELFVRKMDVCFLNVFFSMIWKLGSSKNEQRKLWQLVHACSVFENGIFLSIEWNCCVWSEQTSFCKRKQARKN